MFENVFWILFCNKGNFGLKIFSFLFFVSKIIACLSFSSFLTFSLFIVNCLELGLSSSSFNVIEHSSSYSVVSSLISFSVFILSPLPKDKRPLL